MSWWPPNAAMCNGFQPSLFANRVSAPNFTKSLTSFKFPFIQLWCKAVCPSLSKEFTFTFPSRDSRIFFNSTVSPFRTASKNPFWYLFPAFIANTFIPFDQMKNKTLSLKFPACQIATTPLVGSRPVLCIALIWFTIALERGKICVNISYVCP